MVAIAASVVGAFDPAHDGEPIYVLRSAAVNGIDRCSAGRAVSSSQTTTVGREIVGANEQLGLDFEVQRTAWGNWVDPERRTAQARKFMDRAAIARIPATPWPAGSPEVQRLDALVAELFPDMETTTKPENADTVDEFICFVGECYIKFARAEWFEYRWRGRDRSFYDSVNPGLRWFGDDETEEGFTAWELMHIVVDHSEDGDGFSLLADEMREEYHRIAHSGR